MDSFWLIISSRQCLLPPKDSKLYHRSIQTTQDDSSAYGHLNPWPLVDSETNEKSFPFKEEIETYKVQAINEIKNLMFKENISFKRSYYHAFQNGCTFQKSANGGTLSRTASFHEWRIKKQRQFNRFFVKSFI